MKTAVIDSLEHISVIGNAGSTPELTEISGDDPGVSCDALDALERLTEAFVLDEKVRNELVDLGADIFSSGNETGFRRGFRVGARLMLETLGTPEALKAEGGV